MQATEQPRTLALSIVIPVKGNEATLPATVASLLAQDLDEPFEVIVVVDQDDSAYRSLGSLHADPRLHVLQPPPFPVPGARDANWRRAFGLLAARGKILALTDADMLLEPTWAKTAMELFAETQADCLAGGMTSVDGIGFWGRYADNTALGARTPRFGQAQWLTSDTLGRRGFMPPVTANLLFRHEVVAKVLPHADITHSYEDYAFAQDVVEAGFSILCTDRLSGQHHHRHDTLNKLREYMAGGRGCGQFVRTYPSRHLAIRRTTQLLTVLAAILIFVLGILFLRDVTVIATAALAMVLEAFSLLASRRIEAVVYVPVTLLLGMVFCTGFLCELLFGGPVAIAIDADPRGAWDLATLVDLREHPSPSGIKLSS